MLQVSLEEAVAICKQEVEVMSTARIKLERIAGRICADQYCSAHNIPGFDRSRVDGFAVHSQDLSKLGDHKGLSLLLTGSIRAGELIRATLTPGETWRLMTGAILPQGCAAVIRQEDVNIGSSSITIHREIGWGENIENKGSTVTAGSVLASPGQRLRATDIELLASAGFAEIEVYQRPKVYLIQTGDELVMPGNCLPEGKIYNSNRGQFFALILSSGARPLAGEGPTGDCVERLAEEIMRAVESAPLVIITGGTQQGDYDLVPAVLNKLQARQLFAGVKIRPAHNTGVWYLNRTLVFNLPGNPSGGYLLFHALIRPVLNHLSGLRPSDEAWVSLPLEQATVKAQPQRCLKRGFLSIGQNGQCQLFSLPSWTGQFGWEVIADIPGTTENDQGALRCLPVGCIMS